MRVLLVSLFFVASIGLTQSAMAERPAETASSPGVERVQIETSIIAGLWALLTGKGADEQVEGVDDEICDIEEPQDWCADHAF